MPQTEWFAPAVNYVTANGIMTGNGNRFSPNEKLTRGMMAQILYNIAGGRGSGSANFPDIASGDWFANAAGWAATLAATATESSARMTRSPESSWQQSCNAMRRQMVWPMAHPQSLLPLWIPLRHRIGRRRPSAGQSAQGFSGKSGERLDLAGQAARAEVAQILTNFSQNIAR